MTRPTYLIAEKKGVGVAGRPTTLWKGDDDIWYEAFELGKMSGLATGAMRDRLRRKGYEYEFVLVDKTPIGVMMNGLTQGDKEWQKGAGGNDEWRELGSYKS